MSFLLWRALGWLSPRPRRIPRIRVRRRYLCLGGQAHGRTMELYGSSVVRIPVLTEYGVRALCGEDPVDGLPPKMQVVEYGLQRLADGRVVLTPLTRRRKGAP